MNSARIFGQLRGISQLSRSASSNHLFPRNSSIELRFTQLCKMSMESKPMKKLFTPGPLSVSDRVRKAGGVDFGSRDPAFISIVKSVRENLVKVAGLSLSEYTAVLLQGSGTFALESTIISTRTSDQKELLILSCGAYGRRLGTICTRAGIRAHVEEFGEGEITKPEVVRQLLSSGRFSSVAVVHCETSTGVFNPIVEIGKIVKGFDPKMIFIVDAMSSFGGTLVDFSNADFIVSSANKCLQGIPGLGFVIARKSVLENYKGKSSSLSLDLEDQWRGLESNGQFRFTPPTHGILCLSEALQELEEEGGVPARVERYKANNVIIKEKLRSLGFKTYVNEDNDGHIITSFIIPNGIIFNEFYNYLSSKGLLIYPGKVTEAETFRIGNIGHLFPTDMNQLVGAIEDYLKLKKLKIN